MRESAPRSFASGLRAQESVWREASDAIRERFGIEKE